MPQARKGGFRLPSHLLIDNYWIPRQEADRYCAQRRHWGQVLQDYLRQQGFQAELAFEGSQDGLAVIGLDAEGQLQALIHLDPATLLALERGTSPTQLFASSS